ncbi:hypothetical protein ACFX2I_004142 [Malus domestica]|uniref:Uncharacterized protein n=1 Tax=Malus domestica TaxID=3750 RepID=A0A498IYV4_MALDO|nr:hypothetical protein DVH24_021744 [Malus domestica]
MTRFRPLSPESYPSSPPLIPIDESPTLIPSLSNDIAALIISFVVRPLLASSPPPTHLQIMDALPHLQNPNRHPPDPPPHQPFPPRLPLRPLHRRP